MREVTLCSKYGALPKSKELFHGKEAVITNGFVMICNKCNMDATLFHIPVIDSVALLGVHYNLNVMQIVE
jgi:hypothetical protein